MFEKSKNKQIYVRAVDGESAYIDSKWKKNFKTLRKGDKSEMQAKGAMHFCLNNSARRAEGYAALYKLKIEGGGGGKIQFNSLQMNYTLR